MWTRTFWMKIAAAVISGLLVAGLFPPFRMSAMVWVALVPLLVALWSLDGKRRGWKGYGIGWLTGTVSCMVQFQWLSVVSPLGAALLPFYLGAYWGLFGAFAATWGNPGKSATDESIIATLSRSLRVGFCLAAVWAGLEWLCGWLFTGFGWNGLGVAFHDTPAMAQSADLLGVTGLAMVPVFFQSVLVQAGRRMIEGAHDGKRRTRLDFATAAAIVALLVCYGIIRITTEGRSETARLRTLLVQLNIPQEAARQLWDSVEVHMAYEDETVKGLDTLAETDSARLKEATPISPPSGPSQWLFQKAPAKSKFLATN